MNKSRNRKLSKREDIYKYVLHLVNMKKSGMNFNESINEISFNENNTNSFVQILDRINMNNGKKNAENKQEVNLDNKELVDSLIEEFLKIKVTDYKAILDWIFRYAPISCDNYAKKFNNLIIDRLASSGYIPQGNISAEIDNELILANLREYVDKAGNSFEVSRFLIGQTVASLYEDHFIRDGIVELIYYKRTNKARRLEK